MFLRKTSQHDHDGSPSGVRVFSKLDCAIIASVLAMAVLNLMVMTDHLGAAKAYAADTYATAAMADVPLA